MIRGDLCAFLPFRPAMRCPNAPAARAGQLLARIAAEQSARSAAQEIRSAGANIAGSVSNRSAANRKRTIISSDLWIATYFNLSSTYSGSA